MSSVRCVLGLLVVLSMPGCTAPSSDPASKVEDASPSSPVPTNSGGSSGSLVDAPVGGEAGEGGADAMVPADAATTIDAGEPFEIPALRPDLFAGPDLLSETGLYSALPAGVLADGVREYQPLGELWSDGAAKKRWLMLPESAVIDTVNLDDWVFPTDTRVFKEFVRDGKRVETRMIWKRAPNDWQMTAYLWNPEQTEAYAAPEGRDNANGTPHDVPDATKCLRCHEGRSDRVLGATALQLSHAGPGLTIDALIAEGRLTHPPAAPLALPGDADTQAALAYLHANCGHCHNPEQPSADRHISVYFWQKADALGTLEDTVIYQSLVTDKSSPLWIDAVLERMNDRGGKQQMPPLATEDVDVDGMAKVRVLMDRLRMDVPALPAPATSGHCPNTEAVFQIFDEAGCRSSFCHGTASGSLYFASADELHDVTVAVPAQGDACRDIGISRVEPGDPTRSLLWLKLRSGPPCGTIMPPLVSLTDEQLAAVANWISGCSATP